MTRNFIKPICLCLPIWSLLAWPADASKAVTQNLSKGDVLLVTDAKDAPDSVKQSGKLKRYAQANEEVGLQFNTGQTATVTTNLFPANTIASTHMAVKGKGTDIRYQGKWKGDASGGYPILVLTDHGKLTWEAQAQIDLVMDGSFFTRQIWVQGDGTGTLELAEGFIADRTKDATVANAMGTIRLGGATLVTNHTQSLPYNSRPDGRGGIYHNGHIVFEATTASTWIVQTNQQVYSAQIDFNTDGTIDCQKPLTHNGQRRVCLQVGPGGPFVSSGAFRTKRPDVTITKTGPAMLSLDGQQSYEPGAKLIIEQGLVRMHTDPGAGARVSKTAGPHLSIEVKQGGKLHIAAEVARLHTIHVHAGGELSIEDDSTVELHKPLQAEPGAKLTKAERIELKP